MTDIRNLIIVASVIFATAFLSSATVPAFAQDAIDTTKIVRLPNSKELFAFPQSTAFTTSLPVPEALTALSTLLVNDKWQPYEQAFASQSTGADLAIAYFKRDRDLLSVMITLAPAQNNASSVNYTGLVPGHDLPFPKNAAAIKYDPTRPYLNCLSDSDPESLSRELRKGLQSRGWHPWSAKEGQRVDDGDQKTENGVSAFYVHGSAPSLHVSIGKRKDGQTSVTVEGISAEVLAAAAKTASDTHVDASKPEPKAAEAPPLNTEAPRGDQMDDLVGQIMNEARTAIGDALKDVKKPNAGKSKTDRAVAGAPLAEMSSNNADAAIPVPLPEGSENIAFDNDELAFQNPASVAQVAEFYRSKLKGAGWKEHKTPIDKSNMVVLNFEKAGTGADFTIMRMGDHTQVTGTGTAFEVAKSGPENQDAAEAPSTGDGGSSITADQLEADEAAGLPVPKQSTSRGSEKSMFRVSALADVEAPLQAVLGFYRRELGKRSDWHQQNEDKDKTGATRVQYASPEGPAVLTLSEKSHVTSAVLLVRKQKEAQASGLMPKPGQVRILIGNVLDKDAKISLGKATVVVGAGKGAKAPDGPTLEVKPGTYTVTVRSKGLSAPPETINVAGDEIWGLMIGPGGILPIQMY